MERLCEFCGLVRAVVYCKADSAALCLPCDSSVHAANILSRRHQRSLICDKCNSQSATVRCVVDKICLCHGCNWNGNGCSGPGHPRMKLIFYDGCPSLFELSTFWSSTFYNNNNYIFNQLSINENNSTDSTTATTTSSHQPRMVVGNRLDEVSCDKYETWFPIPNLNPNPPNVNNVNVPFIPQNTLQMPTNILTTDKDSSGTKVCMNVSLFGKIL